MSGAVDLTHVGIFDYVDDVNAVARQFGVPPVVIGWSMGGHIAVIAASGDGYSACVAIDPDPPVDRVDESVELEHGLQTPEDIGYTLDGDPTSACRKCPTSRPRKVASPSRPCATSLS